MAGIFGVTVFNDDIFNTGAAVAGKVGGSYDGWLGQPEIVKPWKQRNLPEEQKLELLITATPQMGKLFSKDLTGLPQLRQYKDKIYDILFSPTTTKTFDELKLAPKPMMAGMLEVRAQVVQDFVSPIYQVQPQMTQRFDKTLYGKKLHGVALMRMAASLFDEDDGLDSFDFDESASDWKGTRQYNDAAKIRTFRHSSSFVGQVVYEKATKEMLIVLGDAVYNFCGVTRAIYNGFRTAASKGRFFNQSIKGLWDC